MINFCLNRGAYSSTIERFAVERFAKEEFVPLAIFLFCIFMAFPDLMST
jgi:hypothetical protein